MCKVVVESSDFGSRSRFLVDLVYTSLSSKGNKTSFIERSTTEHFSSYNIRRFYFTALSVSYLYR